VILHADSTEICRKKSAGVQKMGLVCRFLCCSSAQKPADQHMAEFHWASFGSSAQLEAPTLSALGKAEQEPSSSNTSQNDRYMLVILRGAVTMVYQYLGTPLNQRSQIITLCAWC
jgi:hypothetical protein